jgi:hypothetical protein
MRLAQGPPILCLVQRLFSTFPGGWPAVGLLLLRTAVGPTAILVGANYLGADLDPTVARLAAGVVGVASGASLLLGFLTPVSGAVVAIGSAAIALSWIPASARSVGALPVMFVTIVATAIVLLGPGALSIDSYLFGRREIIIPRGRS